MLIRYHKTYNPSLMHFHINFILVLIIEFHPEFESKFKPKIFTNIWIIEMIIDSLINLEIFFNKKHKFLLQLKTPLIAE